MRGQSTILAAATGLALASAAAPALANDSTAGLAAGGLVFTKSTTIEMRSEDLSISPSEVRVLYRFANTSPQDVTVTVAFPLPDIDTTGYDFTTDIPVDSPGNFLGFTTLVDGKPVKMQLEQKAIGADGVDRTAYLQSLHLPLAPQRQATDDALGRLPKASRDALVKLELANAEEGDPAHGVKPSISATWILKTTYYWTQTFPAGREVTVQHSYTPSVGSFVSTYVGEDPATMGQDEAKTLADERSNYCIDDSLVAAVRARGGPAAGFFEEYIDYVLVTGANWKAPIGDFTMTIDKDKAANFLSFCGDGVKQIGPTRFQVHYTNFTPTTDVHILLIVPRSPS